MSADLQHALEQVTFAATATFSEIAAICEVTLAWLEKPEASDDLETLEVLLCSIQARAMTAESDCTGMAMAAGIAEEPKLPAGPTRVGKEKARV